MQSDNAILKQKFSAYGRKNDHISHIPSSKSLKKVSHASTCSKMQHVKQSTELEEYGKITTHLDELHYQLDGLNDLSISDSIHCASYGSIIVALIRLLQEQEIRAFIKVHEALGNVEEKIIPRILKVLCDMSRVTHKLLRLCLVTLAYHLTLYSEFNEFLETSLLETALDMLLRSADLDDIECSAVKSVAEEAVASTVEQRAKKTYLKRKKRGRKRMWDDHLYDELVNLIEDENLQEWKAQPEILCADMLAAIIFSFLRGESDEFLSQCNRFLSHTRIPSANVIKRKESFIKCNGEAALILFVNTRLRNCKSEIVAPSDTMNAKSLGHLKSVGVALRALEQASVFLSESNHSSPLQEEFVLSSLDFASQLCERCFSREKNLVWVTHPQYFRVAADTFLITMRIMVNMTHRNVAVAEKLQTVEGAPAIFNIFCRLFDFVRCQKSDLNWPRIDEKILFDGLLLSLSALTNCVECNSDICATLFNLSPDFCGLQLLGCTNVCVSLISFFMETMNFNIDHIEIESKFSLPDKKTNDLAPEDIVLSGCTSLLIGFLIKDVPKKARALFRDMPNNTVWLLLRGLHAFVAVHSQLGAICSEMLKSILLVEAVYKSYLPQSVPKIVEIDPLGAQDTDNGSEDGTTSNESSAVCASDQLSTSSENRRICASIELVKSHEYKPLRPQRILVQYRKNICRQLSDGSDTEQSPFDNKCIIRGDADFKLTTKGQKIFSPSITTNTPERTRRKHRSGRQNLGTDPRNSNMISTVTDPSHATSLMKSRPRALNTSESKISITATRKRKKCVAPHHLQSAKTVFEFVESDEEQASLIG